RDLGRGAVAHPSVVEARPPRSRGKPGARADGRRGHVDDRLRAPLRDLQAGRSALLRPGTAGAARRRQRAAGSGAARRQGAPRRPHEASGTSGMKAAMNGVVNFSILDGWWAEAYEPEVGFAIVGEPEAENEDEQDARDAESLFDVLEHEIVAAYYERDELGLP